MKKLITAIAAIATSFGLFAADFAHSVTNDICFKTNNLVVGYDAMGATMLDGDGTAMTVNWFADSLKTNFTEKIANYEQPELKGEAPDQYLAIDTDVKDPVLRTFSAVAKDEGVDNWKYDPVGISDHGVFIDTWTTFTLFDTVPDAPGDSKILVWARETEADDEQGIVGATNLMVTCGFMDKGLPTPTNYVLNVSSVPNMADGIQPETMYRLTIRADKQGNGAKFRVYLNGVRLSTVDLGGGTTLDEFPSLVGGTQDLGAAGFGGTGSLKGIDLLTEIDAAEKVPFAIDDTYLTVTWNKGVVGFFLGDQQIDVEPVEDGETGSTNLVVTAGDTVITPIFEQNPKYKLAEENGYMLDAGQGASELPPNEDGNAEFTIPLYGDYTLAIKAVQDRKGAELWIKLADEENMKKIGAARPYVRNAISAISELDPEDLDNLETVKIVLLMDEQSTDFGDWANIPALGVILDLNGHTMEAVEPWENQELRAIINNQSILTIMDGSSTGGGMIKGVIGNYADNGVMPIFNMGELTIEKANGPAECMFYGLIYDVGTCMINGGRFSDKVETATLPTGKKWSETPIDGYYSLVDAGAKTVTITTNPAIGEFNVLTNGEPVVLSGNTAMIGELDPFTVTFSKAAHYNLDDTTGWTLTDNVYSQEFEADVTAVTLPTGTAITFDVTFANGEHSTITPAAGTSNLVEGTVVAVTATAAAGYEFADEEYTGWTKEQNGTLTQSYEVTAEDTVTAPDATAIPYAITYKEGDSTLDLSPKTYTIAAAVDLPALPAKAGYTAAGWYGNAQFEGDTITTIAAGETGAKTFYVKYTADTYKYTFAKAGSEVGEPIAPIEYTIEAPATITAPACTWTLADHEFAGWTNTVKGGSVIAAGATLEKVLENTELTATWVSTAAPEPTPDDPTAGDITKDDDGNYVITPKADGAVIDVKNAGDNNFIVDVPTDFTIKGVAAGKIKVMCNGEDITSVCKGGDAEGFSTELDPTQTTPELIEATATEQPLVVGTTVDLKIKQSVPGLAYKLLRVGEVGDFSDSAKIMTAATMKGNGETLTLKDSNKPANKAFYKVAVGKDVINESAD